MTVIGCGNVDYGGEEKGGGGEGVKVCLKNETKAVHCPLSTKAQTTDPVVCMYVKTKLTGNDGEFNKFVNCNKWLVF